MTRAVEVAPGLYVVANDVVSVARYITSRQSFDALLNPSKAEPDESTVVVRYRHGGEQILTGVTAAEVAAKLWPGEAPGGRTLSRSEVAAALWNWGGLDGDTTARAIANELGITCEEMEPWSPETDQ